MGTARNNLPFVGSLKDDMYEIIKDMGTGKSFIALSPTLHNYYEVLFESVQNFSRAFLNSMFVLITTVIFTFIVSSMAGYSLQQGQLKWRKILLVVVISLYIIPMEAIMMPLKMHTFTKRQANTLLRHH